MRPRRSRGPRRGSSTEKIATEAQGGPGEDLRATSKIARRPEDGIMTTAKKTETKAASASSSGGFERRRFEASGALEGALSRAIEEGGISRFQAGRIRRAYAFRPDKKAEIDELIEGRCHAARLIDDEGGYGAPDWTAILDFIKGLLPLILQIVALFK